MLRVKVLAAAIVCSLLAVTGVPAAAQVRDGEEYTDAARYAPAPNIPDGTRNQNPQDGKLKGTTLRLKRALLMVRDLEVSLRFYEHVIGLEVYAVDPVYSVDQDTIGNFIFNTPPGTRRRVAQLNTSHETRGLALREIDAEFEVPQRPRLSTILFEASDIMGIHDRAQAAGAQIVGPNLAIVPAREDAPELRYMEMGVVDPDGHIISFFKYFLDNPEDDLAWDEAQESYKVDTEL